MGQALQVTPHKDEAIYVAGNFSQVDGVRRINLVRLKLDGSVDPAFDPGSGMDSSIRNFAILPDGKLVMTGLFTQVQGMPGSVVRLDVNGCLDTSFNPGTINRYLQAVALQADGRVLIGGYFSDFNGIRRTQLVRLHGGDVPPVPLIALQPISYTVAQESGVTLKSLAVSCTPANYQWQFNGVNIAGATQPELVFTNVQPSMAGGYWMVASNSAGASTSSVARLTVVPQPPGLVDPGFKSGFISGGGVRAILVQSDSKILLGGSFTNIQGFERKGIARLNSDGRLDSAFGDGRGVEGKDHFVSSMALQSDGRLFIGGSFRSVHGFTRIGVARLKSDGTVDETFDSGGRVQGSVLSLALQPDQKLLVGTDFVQSIAVAQGANGIVRLHADGTLDTNFSSTLLVGSYSGFTGGRIAVNTIRVLPDSKILVGGLLTAMDSRMISSWPGLARLHPNGQTDTNFNVTLHQFDSRNPPVIYSLNCQRDGKIIIAGLIDRIGTDPRRPWSRSSVARLEPDGALDTNFKVTTASIDAAATSVGLVRAVALNEDGRILVAGTFGFIGGQTAPSIARLNSDGGVDGSFTPGTGPDQLINALVAQSDGTTLVGGDFVTFNGVLQPAIARLKADERSNLARLSVERAAGSIVCIWPVANGDFEVEFTEDVATAANWKTVLGVPETSGLNYRLTLPIDRTRSFFRLRKK